MACSWMTDVLPISDLGEVVGGFYLKTSSHLRGRCPPGFFPEMTEETELRRFHDEIGTELYIGCSRC